MEFCSEHSTVVFYWDQPFQLQLVWVDTVDIIEHFSNRFRLKHGNSWEKPLCELQSRNIIKHVFSTVSTWFEVG